VCFSWVIPRPYTNYDVDTLFLVDVPEGAVKHDAQSTSICDNDSTVLSGYRLLGFEGHA
jgi:hypothetical protein